MKLFPANIYRLKVKIETLRKVRKSVKGVQGFFKDTIKTAVNCSSTLDNKV